MQSCSFSLIFFPFLPCLKNSQLFGLLFATLKNTKSVPKSIMPVQCIPSLFISAWEGSWCATVSTTVDTYKFHGFKGVRALSHAMLFDKRHVVQAIDQDRIFSKENGDTGTLIFDKLFIPTSCLFYEGRVIMITAPGRNLNVELLTAGEALAAMVFLGVAQKVHTEVPVTDPRRAPARHLMRKLIAARDTPDFSIGFTNSTSTTFRSTRVSTPDYWPARIIWRPADTLEESRHQTLSIECSLKDIALGPFDTTWGWQKGDVWFAVMIHVPLQEGGIGNAPSYKVSWSSPMNKSIDWSQPVKNPGQSWTFPAALGWTVRVHSQAGAQKLDLTVTIFDMK